MPINPFIHFSMAHRWSDRLSFFVIFRTASSPFTNLLVLCPKTAPCPESAAQATKAAATADQAADHCKAFPKPLRAGLWLAAILTRSERGANEVRTRSEIKFWETDLLSLLTNSLVATRFRILFRTVKLKSFQRWSRRRQKRRQRASKGDRGERKGHKRGKQGGGDKFERAQTVWDVGTVIDVGTRPERLLKFVCRPKSRKSIQLPRLSSLGV